VFFFKFWQKKAFWINLIETQPPNSRGDVEIILAILDAWISNEM